MKTYSGAITMLEPNQVFVFGSNTEGRHGKGAAAFARIVCGARYGQAKGFQGNSYAIVTKDLTKSIHPSVSVKAIIDQIDELYAIARLLPDKEFLIAYSGYGTNLNGYTPQEMAKMFNSTSVEIPDNIVFEENFAKLL